MKPILMFMMPTCPYCKQALAWQEELLKEHPEYANIPLRIVDETREEEFANAHDYYYVPTYYVDGEKICEGQLTREDVRRVFEMAIQESLTAQI